MKHFLRIASGVETAPLLLALHRLDKMGEIWKEDTYLRDYPQGPFGDTESVILRFPPRSVHETEEALAAHLANFDQHECIDYPNFKQIPEARGLIYNLMAAVQGERLGRCIINKLKPGGQIYPHPDTAAHAEYYDRFHIVLQAGVGSLFTCEDEQVNMRTGEVWWFNNRLMHDVINNSADDRIHLVVDIRTSKPAC